MNHQTMGFDLGDFLQKTIDSATPKLEQAAQDALMKTATTAYDKYGTPIVDGLLKTGAVQLAETLQQDPTKAQQAQQYLVGFTKENVSSGFEQGIEVFKKNWIWFAVGGFGLIALMGATGYTFAKIGGKK